ncbi:immunoglobulin superfamily member 1-like [Mauremys reevesii]|uniref:immunoglobulin superfamily member 1-like n=1 Tax=Mauremys reevesii TaxID=260615 RepID=UPI00193F1649|nr:immunoglobulin superfamily member 1-like [Mauremys reevesii]
MGDACLEQVVDVGTDRPAAPALSVSPWHPVYLPGEAVTLQCMAPPGAHPVTGFQLSRVGGRNLSSGSSDAHTLSITGLGDAGSFTCLYWICPSSRCIQSWESRPISISVTDPPSRPVLSVDPQSGAVREGLPLLVTCMAPGDTGDRRFHFYKDGDELVPGDVESEISTTEPSTSSANVSVLSIPRASPNNTGVFTCGYEENVSGRWVPSPRSRAVNVTVNITETGEFPCPESVCPAPVDRASLLVPDQALVTFSLLSQAALAQPRNMLLACGILVALGMVLAALFWYCRRNKRGQRTSTK